MRIVAGRKYGLVLCDMGRVRVQFIDLMPGRVVGIVGMAVVFGMVQAGLLVAILVLAGKTADVGSAVRFVGVRCRGLLVSRRHGE
jgi:hypothetical protein